MSADRRYVPWSVIDAFYDHDCQEEGMTACATCDDLAVAVQEAAADAVDRYRASKV